MACRVYSSLRRTWPWLFTIGFVVKFYTKIMVHFCSSSKSTGCPKSHCAKVRAYCSACDHLICKISSGMFLKSSSFEKFNGFSEIIVHFFE